MSETEAGALTLFGQVTDEQGNPIEGARVWLVPGNRVMTTDAFGMFAFDDVAAGGYVLRAKRDDLYSGPVDVTVSHPADEPQIVRLRRHGTLVVHVTGREQPIAGADVIIGTDPDPGRFWTVSTDFTGSAVLRGIPTSVTARVQAPGWATAYVGTLGPRDPTGTNEVFIALKRGAPVAGLVIDPEGNPVSGAEITLLDTATFGSVAGDAVADVNGQWRVDAVAPGTYTVYAKSDRFARGRSTIVVEGAQPPDAVIRVSRGGRLVGIVVDSHGAPAAGADVSAEVAGEERKFGRTGADGAFEVVGLRPAKYIVRAGKGQEASRSQTIEVVDDGSVKIENLPS